MIIVSKETLEEYINGVAAHYQEREVFETEIKKVRDLINEQGADPGEMWAVGINELLTLAISFYEKGVKAAFDAEVKDGALNISIR